MSRGVGSLKSLITAIIMYYIEDSIFFNEVNMNKAVAVKNIIIKYSTDSTLSTHLKMFIDILDRIYGENNINLLDETLNNINIRGFMLHLYQEASSYAKADHDEDLILRYCSKMLMMNIYILYRANGIKKFYRYQSSQIKLYILYDKKYFILYPYTTYYHIASDFFKSHTTIIEIKPSENEFNVNMAMNRIKPSENVLQMDTKSANIKYKENSTNVVFENNTPAQKIPENNAKGFSPVKTNSFNNVNLQIKSINKGNNSIRNISAPAPQRNFEVNQAKFVENENTAEKSSNHLTNLLVNEGVNNKPSVIKKNACSMCGEENSALFPLYCQCKICSLCFQDQYFQRKKYNCPKCEEKIDNEKRLNILSFIKEREKYESEMLLQNKKK